MRYVLPMHIISYIKTSSKAYDDIGYKIATSIYDAVHDTYTDPIHVYSDDVCIGVFGGVTAGKHLPKRSTKENCVRYGIQYVAAVYCKTCNKLQKTALCHKIPRSAYGALHKDNLYLDCSICNAHTSDTLDSDVALALAQFTITLDL